MRTYSVDQLNNMTVVELREICRDNGIPKMAKARKDVIVAALSNFYGGQNQVQATPAAQTDTSRIPYVTANVHSFLKKDNSYQSMISVSCGAASSNYPVVGRTVGFIKATYREILNIDAAAGGVVNGKNVEDSYVLRSGDNLEFVRQAGTKG